MAKPQMPAAATTMRAAGVTDLVVGHQFFLKFRQDAALFLCAGDDQLKGGQQPEHLHDGRERHRALAL